MNRFVPRIAITGNIIPAERRNAHDRIAAIYIMLKVFEVFSFFCFTLFFIIHEIEIMYGQHYFDAPVPYGQVIAVLIGTMPDIESPC